MRTIVSISFAALLIVAVGAFGKERSPGESGDASPRPLTPEQRTELLRREYDSARALVSQSGRRVAEAVRALNAAQIRYDDASEKARRELVKHPALVQAGRDVIEARAEVRALREKALRPLRATDEYQKTARDLKLTSLRLDELRKERREADRKRLPFPNESVLEIYRLAQRVMNLEDEIATAEAQALDDHEDFKQAVATLEKAMEESAGTMKDVVRLVRGGRELKEALAELQQCYAELSAANNAIRDARSRQASAAQSLGRSLVAE